MTVTLPGRRNRPAPAAAHPAYRGDIEGLRAVAVLLVVLAHVGVPGVAGGFLGVDVFFVVSGFLITTLLRREIASTGRVDLVRFYARRAVRLLPVATLVILVSLAGAWLWAPPTRFASFAHDALAAATYTMNLRLAGAETDYFGDPAPSPFQHFWSLAVEEQFYLAWPLILLLARGRWALGVLTAGTVASFVWSISKTGYFGTAGRAWELGAGAILSYLAIRRELPWLGWTGLAAVLLGAVTADEGHTFPGLAVAGTVAVIAANGNRLLETAPMRWLGRMSYGWYLWHWPLLLLIAPAGLAARTAAATVALGLAVASHHLLENPVRHHRLWTVRPLRGLLLGLGLSAAAAAIAGAGMIHPPAVPVKGTAADARRAVAAAGNPAITLNRLLLAGQTATDLPRNLNPTLAAAARQRLAPQLDGCHVGLSGPFRPKSDCAYGDRASNRVVVLFGDSHALQWFPTMEALARRHGWRLYSFTRSSCSPAEIAVNERRAQARYLECDDWRREVLTRIARLRPGLVVVSSSVNYRQVLADPSAAPDAVWQTGWVRTLASLKRASRNVTMLVDTPFLTVVPADCLSTRSTSVSSCAAPRRDVLPEPRWREIQRATAVAARIPVVDPVPWLCAAKCPLVVGDTLVYRDSNHLTEAYAKVVAPLLEPHLPRV
ncbi:acyltransferase [Actinoplanes capillaceus]|uniref:Acyltransferase n=1 Tax=Actinoplanes campanulatus TaxID=113559 RepID=A0ABQ3WC47_9ACTN|nr:acyltransferase family protein [Actinoplanes capillaceus]GID44154.1 acyltransferase [Actinoplanes capillaceus]